MKFAIVGFLALGFVVATAAPPQGLLLAHSKFIGATPTMGACGTSPTVAGNDGAGAITVGTGGVATSCVLTFAQTWGTVPHCFVSDRTQVVAMQVVPTATNVTITVSSAFTASSVLDYFCTNHQ